MESADERHSSSVVQYTDEWESLQQHPDPEWFRDAKFGIYTHWGPYSVPEWGDEWYARRMYLNKKKKNGNFYVFHKERYGDPADFGYKDLIPFLLLIILMLMSGQIYLLIRGPSLPDLLQNIMMGLPCGIVT